MKRNSNRSRMNRRQFISVSALTAGAAMLSYSRATEIKGVRLDPSSMLGNIKKEEGSAPLEGATWYVAETVEDGFEYRFPAGTLAKARFLTADMLLDGNTLIVFMLTLKEGEDGRQFNFRFSGLNQCSLRVRMPLSLVDQNRWGIEREGAFLKPRCSGDRVDLGKVDRMRLFVYRKAQRPARWCMTSFTVTEDEVPRIDKPILTKGPLIDELGQSTIHNWPAKTRSVAEVEQRLQQQLEQAPGQSWPGSFTKWGGWKARKLTNGAGFFRTHNDGKRWWLVDPDGYAFWSAGLDCIRVDTTARYDGLESALKWLPEGQPEFAGIFSSAHGDRNQGKSITYLAANFIRTFGSEDWRVKWAKIALAEMKRLRFNTVGNWSEWNFAREAAIPYVRPMDFRARRCSNVYRDFPDVFHAGFAQDAADFAGQLAETRDDPAFIGYFLMNEPQWGFSSELPAVGMLYVTPECPARKELAGWLRGKYADSGALSSAWGTTVSFERVASGRWEGVIPKEALKDLQEFSTLMAGKYFQTLSQACKKVDPNHLNLGMRWAGVPPIWAVEGMRSFDVFSINCYQKKVPFAQTEEIHAMLKMPIVIGEWHFGALDVGLPSSGIGHLKNQIDRGKAYRVYIEDAAANPYCVGTHWFTIYDQSALGRFDGENYNIGFLDICNRPYEELGRAAIASHEAIYDVASGSAKPFSDEPEYLPNLY
jgi:hypothetical protein